MKEMECKAKKKKSIKIQTVDVGKIKKIVETERKIIRSNRIQ